jgi:hypothetical protein
MLMVSSRAGHSDVLSTWHAHDGLEISAIALSGLPLRIAVVSPMEGTIGQHEVPKV